MKAQFCEWTQVYTGEQLRSLFAYISLGLMGDSVVSWIGPCNVGFDSMVDGEDLREKSEIQGDRMLHFIVEVFHQNLFSTVCLQRLFSSLAIEALLEMDEELLPSLRRDGDDIFYEDGKLSISIATVSPVSGLIHFAVNCTNEGTPSEVETAALDEMGIDPQAFAEELMRLFTVEVQTIHQATMKVFSVK